MENRHTANYLFISEKSKTTGYIDNIIIPMELINILITIQINATESKIVIGIKNRDEDVEMTATNEQAANTLKKYQTWLRYK